MLINLYDYRINIRTAGPSMHDNLRSELYFAGCQRAMNGTPCKGCFNYDLWQSDVGSMIDHKLIVRKLNDMGSVKSVTIVGGEPTDQINGLVELCKELKANGYHIIVITWKSLEDIWKFDDVNKYIELFYNIDMLVDGVYDEHQRIYDDTETVPLYSFVGSSNQLIHDFSKYTKDHKVFESYRITKDIIDMKIREDGGAEFVRRN